MLLKQRAIIDRITHKLIDGNDAYRFRFNFGGEKQTAFAFATVAKCAPRFKYLLSACGVKPTDDISGVLNKELCITVSECFGISPDTGNKYTTLVAEHFEPISKLYVEKGDETKKGGTR